MEFVRGVLSEPWSRLGKSHRKPHETQGFLSVGFRKPCKTYGFLSMGFRKPRKTIQTQLFKVSIWRGCWRHFGEVFGARGVDGTS